ncbi:unnamed protein product [Haemonchus placei]|uniref:glucuronosyltransferase n=1 Tax=Haemonchus placei TaxID=6290 RepID=A0A0N4WB81_HAEPC|nr:unnamed protein product [Haemonchus placei]
MLERHQTHCERMLDDQRFLQYLRTQKPDVVLLDHFLQECMGGLAFLLNSSVVQYSNWPIADGYITSLNVPANPSATPKTGKQRNFQVFSHIISRYRGDRTPFSAFESDCVCRPFISRVARLAFSKQINGHGMSFGQRLINTLFHSIIIITRYIQIYVLNSMFTRKGFPQVEIVRSEAERLIYAGRSEFLFDVVRPINNRVKHFGGVSKMDPRDYVTVLPHASPRRTSTTNFQSSSTGIRYMNSSLDRLSRSNSTNMPLSFISCFCSSKPSAKRSSATRRPRLYENIASEPMTKRFNAISKEFPQLNWPSLVTKPFILVSFGSVAQVRMIDYPNQSHHTRSLNVFYSWRLLQPGVKRKTPFLLKRPSMVASWAPQYPPKHFNLVQAQYMSMELVERFLEAFSQSSFTVIWQTNSAFESLLWARNISVPKNVLLSNWVPVKHILAHPNLQYLICHGGINTINELLLFGGDQSSNLQRLVDLGAAAKMSVEQIAQGALLPAMRRFERNLDRYWDRVGQLTKMLESYHELHSDEQNFWIGWTVRNGKRLRGRHLLRLNYIGDAENAFWISLALAFVGLTVILS